MSTEEIRVTRARCGQNGKTTVVVELERDELSYLIDFILEDLRAWSEKGFESGEEGQFQRIVSIVSKLREAIGENEITFI